MASFGSFQQPSTRFISAPTPAERRGSGAGRLAARGAPASSYEMHSAAPATKPRISRRNTRRPWEWPSARRSLPAGVKPGVEPLRDGPAAQARRQVRVPPPPRGGGKAVVGKGTNTGGVFNAMPFSARPFLTRHTNLLYFIYLQEGGEG